MPTVRLTPRAPQGVMVTGMATKASDQRITGTAMAETSAARAEKVPLRPCGEGSGSGLAAIGSEPLSDPLASREREPAASEAAAVGSAALLRLLAWLSPAF